MNCFTLDSFSPALAGAGPIQQLLAVAVRGLLGAAVAVAARLTVLRAVAVVAGGRA